MTVLNQIADWYFSKGTLPRWGVAILDTLLCVMSGLFVILIFRNASWMPINATTALRTICGITIVDIVMFKIFHTYSGVIRYSSFTDLKRVSYAMLSACFAVILIHYSILYLDKPESYEIIYPLGTRHIIAIYLASTIAMSSMRILIKLVYDSAYMSTHAKGTYIYGVQSGGVSLAKHIATEKPARFRLKGFINDNRDFMSKILMGKRVYPLDDNIIDRMQKDDATTLLISPLRNNAFRKNTEFQNKLIEAGIKIYMIPQAKEWDDKHPVVTTGQLKKVEVEDLLPREEIQMDMDAIGKMLTGKVILITGSAGSIGSEMIRQIAIYKPAKLILVDQAETPQHDIRCMMADKWPDIDTKTFVTSICKADRMEQIFSTYHPDYVFHAAAYKHVPMMEDNPSESVQNNIIGTKIIADLSVKYGVKKFVMISTDKAVNPTNVMGCSKRICEIYVQSLDKAEKEGKIKGTTQFVTTRFGNVLGSNGSVIPLFQEQIKNGGPVTVTHPDIIRFFMLIPEACELVLEAGIQGHGGEIFVFDMGKPVKIVDLAKRMIKLSGADDVKIKFTGLRAGEKLYEEVLNDKEQSKRTFHPKINIAGVREYDYDNINKEIQELDKISKEYDNMKTVMMMKRIVPEYKSQNSVYEQLDK